ncbi:GNAT family N-acetyltransferase [Kineococcus sp. T13]|uniref:GNAT family N-acetyltransferase n=1 Tax=Kineococcus vitellinus TaxID=2696565 RepID=UPI0014123EE7|nr:GNAT family N-acetyltransferase [Kineococcus vitellinus]
MAAVDDLVVTHDEQAHRWEGRLAGRVVALVDYVPQDGAVALVHTEVVPEHEHQGLATRVVEAALADARARGLGVVPACSFVRLHLRRHAGEHAGGA